MKLLPPLVLSLFILTACETRLVNKVDRERVAEAKAGLEAIQQTAQSGDPDALKIILLLADGAHGFISAVCTAIDAPVVPPVTVPGDYKAKGEKAAEDAKVEKQVTNTILGIAHWGIEAAIAALTLAVPSLGLLVARGRATITSLLKAGEAMKAELDTDVDGAPDTKLKDRRKQILDAALDTTDIKRIQAARRARGEHT